VKLVVSKEALADIERLRAFLDEKEEAAGRHAVAVLQRAVGSLEIFPGRGRPSGISGVKGTRRAVRQLSLCRALLAR
jgi:hypothetical protein